jgi:hypothetical protein
MYHFETMVQVENSECIHNGHNLVNNELCVPGADTASVKYVGHLNEFPLDVLLICSETLQHLDTTLNAIIMGNLGDSICDLSHRHTQYIIIIHRHIV